MRKKLSALTHRFGLALVGALAFPGQALAGWGDDNWGTLVWGAAVSGPEVPGLGLLGGMILAMGLAAIAAWMLRKRRSALGLALGLVLLAIPLIVVADVLVLPNTFTNGTVADADEVNANFEAVETAVEDNDSRITAAQGTANAALTDAAAAQTTADAAAAGHTVDSNTQLDEAAVDGFVANNGFGLATDVSANTAAIAALGGAATGLEACSDGLTVADHDTGLLWEKKTGTPVALPGMICSSVICPDPHNVANTYEWSDTGTYFLARLNGLYDPVAATGCFANRCDWRLPEISELQTILIGPGAAPGQATTCSNSAVDPCIDPDFAAIGGPTGSSGYWSASATSPDSAWFAGFSFGNVVTVGKSVGLFVRAVRAGSCTS